VAGARWRLDAEGTIGLAGDGDLRHTVTLASRQSMLGWQAGAGTEIKLHAPTSCG
jgi:hypothetical protein